MTYSLSQRLNDNVSSDDIYIPSFHKPVHNDRVGDSHGINFKRRLDLELGRLECIWIEITLTNNKHILFGNFYRPPNVDASYLNLIEDSIDLTQVLDEPTHFTEHSSSIIDLLLVSNPRSVLLSGVGEHFFEQDTSYHCPVYGGFKFSKPKH